MNHHPQSFVGSLVDLHGGAMPLRREKLWKYQIQLRYKTSFEGP